LGMIGIGVQSIRVSFKKIKIGGCVIAIIFLSLLSVRTIIRNMDWHDGLTLYTHDSKISDNFDLENNLGGEYGKKNKLTEALVHYKKSVELLPNGINLYNVGNTYATMHNPQEAEYYYRKAISNNYFSLHNKNHIAPSYLLSSYVALSSLSLSLGKPMDARTFAKEGLVINPQYGYLWILLALSDYQLHNQKEALSDLEKASAFIPRENLDYLHEHIVNKQTIPFRFNGSTTLIMPPDF